MSIHLGPDGELWERVDDTWEPVYDTRPDEPPYRRCPQFATSDPHDEHTWHTETGGWYTCDGGRADDLDEVERLADAGAYD